MKYTPHLIVMVINIGLGLILIIPAFIQLNGLYSTGYKDIHVILFMLLGYIIIFLSLIWYLPKMEEEDDTSTG